MSSRYEPSRLATRTNDESEIAAAIVALRAERPHAAQLQALAARLAPELASPTLAGAAASALAGWAKWLSALTLSLALGAYLMSAVQRPPHGTHVEARARQPQALSTSAPPAAPPIGLPSPASTEPVAPAAQPLAPRARTHARRESAEVTAVAPGPAAELVLLERSRAALDVDAAAALDLAEQHAHSYPQGIFTQEREVLAIEALLKLGRKPAARARAERFLARYPDSPHAQRVRAWIDRTPDSLQR